MTPSRVDTFGSWQGVLILLLMYGGSAFVGVMSTTQAALNSKLGQVSGEAIYGAVLYVITCLVGYLLCLTP